MGESATIRVKKEMGLHHKEIFRILPRVFGDRKFQISGTRISHSENGKSLLIQLSEEGVRALGPTLKIPVTFVDFEFTGYTEAEKGEFMEKFDLHFLKAGG